MVTHADIFEVRDKYLRQYQSFLASLSGALIDSLNNPTLPSLVSKHEHVNVLVGRFLVAYTQSLQPLREDVRRLVGVDNEDPLVRSFLAEISQGLISALLDIARRESHAVSRLALEVLMSVTALSSDQSATLNLLEQRMRVTDARGRRWRSERYVTILVQSSLFKAVNESKLYLADANKKFHVVFEDPNKPRLIISREDYQKLKFRDMIFHPNSSALVVEIP